MNSIIQYPDSLSLIGNMKHLVIHRSTPDEVKVELWLGVADESSPLITHTYMPDHEGLVDIDLKDVVESHLSFELRDFSEAYAQEHIAEDFTVRVTFSGNDHTDLAFTVVRTGVLNLADTPENFLRQNFLTWQPSLKPVTYYMPEFLTYYAQTNVTVKCKAYRASGTLLNTVVLASIPAGSCYTIPVGYAVVAGQVSSLPGYYDVWVENENGDRLTYKQRYYASDIKSEEEEWILFENSLGGIDTFRAYGDSQLTASHEHKVAEIEEVCEEYRVDTERTFKKSTGYLDNRERRWLLDFFPSKGKYLYADSLIRRIVVTEDDVSYSRRDLPSEYNFTYKFAETKPYLSLPRTDIPLDEMRIEIPDVGSFTIAPRLVEFPRQQLSGGALFPVQNPYSEQWGTTSLAFLIDYISQALGLEEISDTFLSRLYDDIAEGHITFMQGLTALAPIILGSYVEGLRGGKLTPEGCAELEELWVRALATIGDGALHYDREGNIAPALKVKGDSTFTGSLSSPEFVSNFLGGSGWALQRKPFINSAGQTEYRYVLEVDGLDVRHIIRVYELIASQMVGENDNRVFTAMMDVHHYDPATGKVWMNTNQGKLLMPLRVGDCIMVSRYQPGNDVASGGDGYITKSYELRLTEVGEGGMTDENGDRLDWVKFEAFTTMMDAGTPETLIEKHDSFCRVDNLTDTDRKGIIQMITVGTNAPYMDILYGMKTDPQHALKGRVGNLEGVRTNEFGQLKGFGIYTNNFYGTGEFHDSQTGERFNARVSATKTMLSSMYKETVCDISEEDNIIANGFFANGIEKWIPRNLDGSTPEAQGMTDVFGSEGMPLLMNGQIVTAKNVQQAAVVEYDSIPMLMLNAMGVAQSFSDLGDVPNHKELTNDSSTTTADVSDTLYMGVRILPLTDGELRVSFIKTGGPTTGWNRRLTASLEWMLVQEQDSVLSPWDLSGTGLLVVSYSGECLIRFVALTTDPVASSRIDYMTRITQTARIIKAEADAVYSTRTMHAELSLQVSGIATEVTNNKDASDRALSALSGRIGSIETWENNTATWITQTDAVIDLWAAQFDANGQIIRFAGIETDISNIQTTVTNNYNASEAALAALRNRTTALETWENGTATWITQTNNRLTQWASSFNADGSIKDLAQLRTDVNGLLGTVGSLATTAAMEAYINQLDSYISSVNSTANSNASAISQINSSIRLIVNQFNSDGSVKTSSQIAVAIDDIKQEIVNSLGTVGIYLDGANMGIRMQANDFSLWDTTGTDKLFGVDNSGYLWLKGGIKSGSVILDNNNNEYNASAAINIYRVHSITASSSNVYLSMANGSVQAICRSTYNVDKNIYLPTLADIRSALGIAYNDTRDFCCQLTIINQSEIGGNTYDVDGMIIRGDTHSYTTAVTSTSARPRIMRGSGDTFIQLESRFSAVFFITYISQRFIANYIKG